MLRDEIDRLERQLGCVNQQLEESERVNAQYWRRITELEQLNRLADKDQTIAAMKDAQNNQEEDEAIAEQVNAFQQ